MTCGESNSIGISLIGLGNWIKGSQGCQVPLSHLCELDAVRARCKLPSLARSANAKHYQEHLHWECGLDAVAATEYQPRSQRLIGVICGPLARCEHRVCLALDQAGHCIAVIGGAISADRCRGPL